MVHLFLSMVVLCPPAFGQERRVIPVSVIDKDGKIVAGLTAENFRGKFRGKRVKIQTVNSDFESRQVAILVDVSTSMSDYPRVHEAAWKAAHDAATILSARHAVSLLTFTDKVVQEVGFRRGRKALLERIGVLASRPSRVEARTAIYGAVRDVLTYLPEISFGDVIYVITDADDNQSQIDWQELEPALARRGVRLFYVCLPTAPAPMEAGLLGEMAVDCRRLAEASGGRGYSPPGGRLLYPSAQLIFPSLSVEKVIEEGRKLIPLMENLYTIELELPFVVERSGKWKLEVVDERGKKMKGVKVIYPRLLVPLQRPAKN